MGFLLCAPRNHGTHAAGSAGFVKASFEVLMNLAILVFVLDLRAALFHAHLDRLIVTEGDKVVTPTVPA